MGEWLAVRSPSTSKHIVMLFIFQRPILSSLSLMSLCDSYSSTLSSVLTIAEISPPHMLCLLLHFHNEGRNFFSHLLDKSSS